MTASSQEEAWPFDRVQAALPIPSSLDEPRLQGCGTEMFQKGTLGRKGSILTNGHKCPSAAAAAVSMTGADS